MKAISMKAMFMKTMFIQASKNKCVQNYDGSQLRPLFAYENFKIEGPSIVSWVSPCQVSLAHMVDYEDKITSSVIASDLMLHFIVEFFPANLLAGVSLQRLLASLVKDEIELELIRKKVLSSKFYISRKGDDLYVYKDNKNTGKLSISIASVSAVSTQIHFALNITTEGTPVKTSSLAKLILNPQSFAKKVMNRFSKEYESVVFATQKVKPL